MVFARLLEHILQRQLGRYIEDLDRRQLSVSIWSGKIELENLNLKKNLIEKLRLPVHLLMGKIGKLQISVPWNQLHQKPVEIKIESVNIVVTPRGRNEWTDEQQSISTSANLRQKFLDEFTKMLFNDLIKAKDTIEKEQGWLTKFGTRTLDNIQVQIYNLHVRFESCNPHFSNDLFSMGMTLEQLTIQTTNSDWEAQFIDRTVKQQSVKPLHKVLDIQNFGIYYKPNDLFFVTELVTEDERINQLNTLFPVGSCKITQYEKSYLLQPVKLITKLKIEPKNAYRTTLSLDIENVDICMQRKQLENILRLIELDRKYTRKQEKFQYAQYATFAKKLVAMKQEYGNLDDDIGALKELFLRLYLSRPEADKLFILAKNQENASSKSEVVSSTAATETIQSQHPTTRAEKEHFETILMGTDIVTLKEWLTSCSKEKAQEYLDRVSLEQKAADTKQSLRNYIGSWFYRSSSNTSMKTTITNDDTTAQQSHKNQQRRALFNQAPIYESTAKTADQNQHQDHRQDDRPDLVQDNLDEDDEFQDALDSQDQLTAQEGMIQKSNSSQLVDSDDEFFDVNDNEQLILQAFSQENQSQTIQTDKDQDETKQYKLYNNEDDDSQINANFTLGRFRLTLLYDHVERSGIEIFTQELGISLKKYGNNDSSSTSTRSLFAHELHARLERFEIYSIEAAGNNTGKVAILEQINYYEPFSDSQKKKPEEESKEQLKGQQQEEVLKLVLIKHNIFQGSEISSSADDQKIDMEMNLAIEPIKLTYRPNQIKKLINFFSVKDLTPETHKEAKKLRKQLEDNLKRKVKNNMMNHEQNKSKNKIKIQITCPVLEVPFSNNPIWLEDMQSQGQNHNLKVEEKWIISIGDLDFTNFQEGTTPNTIRELSHGDFAQSHKNFRIKFTDSNLKFQQGSRLDQSLTADPSHVIGNFCLNLDLAIKKKKGDEISDVKQDSDMPGVCIDGKMSDLLVSLTPYTYCNLTQIHKLFVANQSSSKQSIVVSNGSLSLSLSSLQHRASIQGKTTLSSKYNDLDSEPVVFHALLYGDKLIFYAKEQDKSYDRAKEDSEDQKDTTTDNDDLIAQSMQALFKERGFTMDQGNIEDRLPLRQYALNGCRIESNSDQCSLSLQNGQLETCKLIFETIEQMTAWMEAIQSSTKVMEKKLLMSQDPINLLTQQNKESQAMKETLDKLLFEESSQSVQPNFVDSQEQEDTKLIVQQAQDEEQEKTNSLQSSFNFEAPSIKIILKADRNQIDPFKGIFDPYDANLFESQDELIESWKLVLDTRSFKIQSVNRKYDKDLSINFSYILINEDKHQNDEQRFPWLLKSEQGIALNISSISRDAQLYDNVDTTIAITGGIIEANWNPKALNRLLRFLRFINFKNFVFKRCLNQTLECLKQVKIIQKEREQKNSEKEQTESVKADKLKQVQQNCETDPYVKILVPVKIQQLKIMCLHPQNDSYPIFTAVCDDFQIDYSVFIDHVIQDISIKTLQILDHSNYPNTLDPKKVYPRNADIMSTQIIDRNKKTTTSRNEQQSSNMFEMKILMFQHPLERTCPKQRLEEHKCHDKFMKIDIRYIKLAFMHEYLYRLQNYLFHQILGALSNSNPYADCEKHAKKQFQELMNLAKMQRPDHQQEVEHNTNKLLLLDPLKLHPQWNSLNAHIFQDELQQSPFGIGMDIKLYEPLVIIKDRFYRTDTGEIRLNANIISISSKTARKSGRYRKQPKKTIGVSAMLIKCKGISLEYLPSANDQPQFNILAPTNMIIEQETVSWSPILNEHQFMTEGIDFTDLDISKLIRIKCEPIKLKLIKKVFTYFMQCNDLNVSYTDMNQQKFQLGMWNDSDSYKILQLDQETQEKYKDSKLVYQQKFLIDIPSLSIELFDQRGKDSMSFAELVFWNYHFEMLKFHDGRKQLDIASNSFQILQSVKSQKLKQVIMGHVRTSNTIYTDEDFYRFNIDQIIAKSVANKSKNNQDECSPSKQRKDLQSKERQQYKHRQALLLRNNFFIKIKMFASGDKKIKIHFQQPKVHARADILSQIAQFFNSAWPIYTKEMKDKPHGWSEDQQANQARQEIVLNMQEALICLPNQEGSQTSVVFSGDIQLCKQRENINHVKLNLLEKMSIEAEQVLDQLPDMEIEGILNEKVVQGSLSANTNLIEISLKNFGSYFCQKRDLNGKQLKDLKKREIFSPHNINFSISNLIELLIGEKQDDDPDPAKAQRLMTFQKLQKTDIQLDWILLKLGFHDFQTLQKTIEFSQSLIPQQNYEKIPNKVKNSDKLKIEESKDVKNDQAELKELSSQVIKYFYYTTTQSKKLQVISKEQLSRKEHDDKFKVIEEELELKDLHLESQGLQVIVINDYMGIYQPVFSVSLAKTFYQEAMLENAVKEGNTHLQVSSSYYNAIESIWEPIVELLDVEILYKQQGQLKSREIQLSVEENLNLNITLDLLQTIRDTMRTIKEIQRRKADQQRETDFDTFNSGKLIQERKINISDVDRDREDQQKTSSDQTYRVQEADTLISPYAIRNLTEGQIVIQRELTDEEISKREQHERKKKQGSSRPKNSQLKMASNSQLTAIAEEIDESSYIENDESDNEQQQSKNSTLISTSNLDILSLQNQSEETKTLKDNDNQSPAKIQQNIQIPTEQRSKKKYFKNVLKVDSGQLKDYSIDQNAIIQNMNTYFKDIKANEHHQETIQVVFQSQSKAPIRDINIFKNQKPSRHYYLSAKYKEFVCYSLKLENMKRVLTIRTQFLLVNQTMHEYQIKIVSLLNKSMFEIKIIGAGQSLALPEMYNQSALQIKLAADSDSSESPEGTSWSEEWQIHSLKHKLPIAKPQYVRHGHAYTFLSKYPAQLIESYDIRLKPPLVLTNCLPVDIKIQFENSSKEMQLVKLAQEETRHIQCLDMRKQKLTLQIEIEGYTKTVLELDTQVSYAKEDHIITKDVKEKDGRRCKLSLNVHISHKKAGFKICFNVQNCLINSTGLDLLFFYEKPSEQEETSLTDLANMVSGPIQNLCRTQFGSFLEEQKTQTIVHMMSNTKEVFAKLEGSSSVSEPIVTFTHGGNGNFTLIQEQELFEFAYSTHVYRCSASSSILTKVTEVYPKYMVMNCTQSILIFAQDKEQNSSCPLSVSSGSQAPFHWANESEQRLMSVQIIPKDSLYSLSMYEWSIGFSLEETGSITVKNSQNKEEHLIARNFQNKKHLANNYYTQDQSQKGLLDQIFSSDVKNRGNNSLVMQPLCKSNKRLLRINRKLHDQQILIIVEEEEEELPSMRIQNKCSNLSIVFQQIGNTNQQDIEVCDPKESIPFAWSDPKGTKTIQVRFYNGKFEFPSQKQIQHGIQSIQRNRMLKIPTYDKKTREESIADHINVSFDQLNQDKQQIMFSEFIPNMKPVFMSIVTNGYTKILKFDSKPPSYQQEEQKQSDEQAFEELSVTKIQASIKLTNISICQPGRELMNIQFEQISTLIAKTQRQTKFEFNLKSIQIDNQSELDPVYHITLKATDLLSLIEQSSTQQQKNTAITEYIPLDVFQLKLAMRSDFPNVTYFEHMAFLLQRLDIELELAHVMLLYEFFKKISKIFDQNYVTQHQIFKRNPQRQKESSPLQSTINLREHDESGFLVISDEQEKNRQPNSLLYQNQQQHTQQATIDYDFQNMSYLTKYKQHAESKNSIVQNIRRATINLKRLRSQASVENQQNDHVDKSAQSLALNAEIDQDQCQSDDYIERLIDDVQNEQGENNFSAGENNEESEEEQEEIKVILQHKEIQRLYINKFFSSPIAIRISLLKQGEIENDNSTSNDELTFIKKIANIGLSVITIDQMPIKINSFEISNVYGNFADISEMFKRHFKYKIKASVFEMFNATNLLGKPTNNFVSVGSGFKDVYYEPSDGFRSDTFGAEPNVDGEYEVIPTSLKFKDTEQKGQLNKLGQNFKQLSSALLHLTNDQKFREQRTRKMIKIKPKNMAEGMSQGIGTAYDSAFDGVKGVVYKPAEGFRKDGIAGFAQGALQGMAGLLVKPVAGAMDMVSKTSQGIEAGIQKNSKQLTMRTRPPRVFYGKEKVIRNYEILHANMHLIVPKLCYRIVDCPNELLQVDLNNFIDAWVLDDQNRERLRWSMLLTTSSQLIRIQKYVSNEARLEDVQANRLLKHIFVGQGLIQVYSVNQYSKMQSINTIVSDDEKYTFHLSFEYQQGEIYEETFMISDPQIAKAVKRTLENLLAQAQKQKLQSTQKSQNSSGGHRVHRMSRQ